MPSHGKHDATGRSTGKRTGRDRKINSVPPPFVQLPRELLISPSWRLMSTNTARLMNFLLVEQMNHAGMENGNLMATYEQLTDYGLTRCKITEAIEEAEFLGLIRSKRGGRWAGSNQPSQYRLTFYADKNGCPATNEWKTRTEEQIRAWKKDRAANRKARKEYRQKQIPASRSRGTVPLHVGVPEGLEKTAN